MNLYNLYMSVVHQGQDPGSGNKEGVVCSEFTAIVITDRKLGLSLFFFNHHVLAILNNASDKILLPVGAKQFPLTCFKDITGALYCGHATLTRSEKEASCVWTNHKSVSSAILML